MRPESDSDVHSFDERPRWSKRELGVDARMAPEFRPLDTRTPNKLVARRLGTCAVKSPYPYIEEPASGSVNNGQRRHVPRVPATYSRRTRLRQRMLELLPKDRLNQRWPRSRSVYLEQSIHRSTLRILAEHDREALATELAGPRGLSTIPAAPRACSSIADRESVANELGHRCVIVIGRPMTLEIVEVILAVGWVLLSRQTTLAEGAGQVVTYQLPDVDD